MVTTGCRRLFYSQVSHCIRRRDQCCLLFWCGTSCLGQCVVRHSLEDLPFAGFLQYDRLPWFDASFKELLFTGVIANCSFRDVLANNLKSKVEGNKRFRSAFFGRGDVGNYPFSWFMVMVKMRRTGLVWLSASFYMQNGIFMETEGSTCTKKQEK